MESNTAVIGKRVWRILRVALFMFRKGISKGKLLMHLNNYIINKRPIASHHHRVSANILQFSAAREYEFSCSNTPKRHRHNPFFACSNAPPTLDDETAAVKGVLEMMKNESAVEGSPMVMRRLIRVTDSPFPVVDNNEKDNQVDKAAEDFIKRFYKDLRNQTLPS